MINKSWIVLLLLLCSVWAREAEVVNYESKIVSTIVRTLFPNDRHLSIYSDDFQKAQRVLRGLSLSIEIVTSSQKADLCLLYRPESQECLHKSVVAMGRRVLKYYKETPAAAFYWLKGRPNVIFCLEWLNEHNRRLDVSMYPYVGKCRE